MNGGILALMIAGLVGFFAGAYLAATGERTTGILLMAMGLVFQGVTLARLRAAKNKDNTDAG